MRPRDALPEVEVCVEGFLDRAFWREHFKPFPKYKFNINFRKHEGRYLPGKDSLMREEYVATLGDRKIICIDSDYDWLVEDYHGYSKTIQTSPYIFQTYLYSIENYKLHPSVVDDHLHKATLMDVPVSWAGELVSTRLWRLFLIHIASMRKHDGKYDLAAFDGDLKKVEFDIETKSLSKVTENHLQAREQHFVAYEKENRLEIDKAGKDIEAMRFGAKNCFLLMNGHVVKDNVMVPLFAKAAKAARGRQHAQISTLADESKLRDNLRCQYENLTYNKKMTPRERISQIIDDCTDYAGVEEGMPRIHEDLTHLFA